MLRNRRRAALTIASLAFSIFLIATLEGLLDYLKNFPLHTGGATRLVCHNRVSFLNRLPIAHGDKIHNIPGVVGVTPYTYFFGGYRDDLPSNSFAQFAVDPEELHRVIPEIEVVDPATGAPKPELYEDFRADRMGALAGRDLFKRYHWKIGDRITLKGTVYPANLELTLRGAFVAKGAEDQILYFAYKSFDEALGRIGTTTAFMLRADTLDSMASVIAKIDAQFENSDHETLTESEQSMRGHAIGFLGNVEFFVRAIGLAVAFTMLMVAANTTAMAARERVHELAILRALGFDSPRLLRYLLSESAMLAFAGAAIGAGLAAAAAPIAMLIFSDMQIFTRFFGHYRLPAAIAVSSTFLGAVVGALAAVFPAWSACTRPIAATIRRVG